MDSAATSRLRPSTNRIGSFLFRARVVREEWNETRKTWGRKVVVWESVYCYRNRDLPTKTYGPAAMTVAQTAAHLMRKQT